MILYNSENSIRDTRPFCRPLVCLSSIVKYSLLHLSYSSEPVMRRDCQILLKLLPLTYWLEPPLCATYITSGVRDGWGGPRAVPRQGKCKNRLQLAILLIL